MNREIKNVEQIRSLLGRMDRLIDDARNKREGVGREGVGREGVARTAPTQSSAPTSPSAAPPNVPRPVQPSTPQRMLPPHAPRMPDGSSLANGRSAQPNLPQRLKAKPKRAESPDPLQDFQQRQAS